MLPRRRWAGEEVLGILPLLVEQVRQILTAAPNLVRQNLEEIRLRRGRPLMVVVRDGDVMLAKDGTPVQDPRLAYTVSGEDVTRTLQLMSGSSLYAFEEEIRSGYLTVRGGHRVGLVGEAVIEGGRVKTLKHLSGLNVRLCREVIGAADPVINRVVVGGNPGVVLNTLIVSPPGAGKTTLLRDLVRQISDGVPHLNFRGAKVAVVDERSEVAGCYQGVPQKDVGIRTDVLDGCPKATGIMMVIRSMSPHVVATDEIGSPQDAAALREAVNAGVSVLATAHAASLADLKRRETVASLLDKGLFERLIFLGRSRGVGTVEAILDIGARGVRGAVTGRRV